MTYEDATAPERIDASTGEGRSARLRAATAPQHRDAETRSFITKLMNGELDLRAYTAYLAQYAYVYQALESRHSAEDDPAPLRNGSLGPVQLARAAAIESDLRALGADDWREEHSPLPATTEYVERMLAIAPDDIPRYLAHHYTRYLGDLSGGQAIAALVTKHYGASAEQLAFYRFDGIDSPVRFKRAYREAIDALDFTDAQDRALLDEAQVAFGLNAAIFDALDAHVAAPTT